MRACSVRAWVALVSSLIVVTLRALRPGPMGLTGYLNIAVFGLVAIASAWSLLRNARAGA